MKRVGIFATLILAIPLAVLGYTSPGKPQGFVNDFAKILSNESATSLNSLLTDFSKQTSIEIAVVTVPSLDNETIETYSVKLFEEWGIGKKGKDNGVLFIVAPNDRQVRIEVGYGLESVLTDAQSFGIIQKIILPEFKNNDYESGIMKGTQAIISVVKSEADYSEQTDQGTGKGIWDLFSRFGFIFFIIIASILGRSKSWWLGGVFGAIAGLIVGVVTGSIVTGIFAVILLTLFGLFLDFILSKGGGHGGPWIGGGFGGSGGGGFGGFGGGRSGGGGSSGSW